MPKERNPAIHICAVIYKLKEDSDWKHGVAVIEKPGLSSITVLIDARGDAETAPDGGSPDIWDYRLQPEIGAISIPVD